MSAHLALLLSQNTSTAASSSSDSRAQRVSVTGPAAVALTAPAQHSSDVVTRPFTSPEAVLLLEGDLTLLQRLVQSGCASSLADDVRRTLLDLIKASGAYRQRQSMMTQHSTICLCQSHIWRGSRLV